MATVKPHGFFAHINSYKRFPPGGCRDLLLLELAICHREKGNIPTAIELALQATELVPDHHVGWWLLGNLNRESSLEGRKKFAKQYVSRAERLEEDPRTDRQVAQSLPKEILHFWSENAREG